MAVCDVAVVGLGAMGSSAALALADRGQRVIGLDPFPPGHDHGSSHGESRAIRLAYFEHPSYVPLLRAAYAGWHALEARTRREVLTRTGILEAGIANSPVVAGSLQASQLHDLPHEHLDAGAIRARFPAFTLPPDWHGLFQPDGGFLRPELALQLTADLARAAGADLRTGAWVRRIEPRPGHIAIQTEDGWIEAGATVIAAGGWIADLAPALRGRLQLTRQVMGWFQPARPADFAPGRFPVFVLDAVEDTIYGFPDFAGSGVKAASHRASGLLAHAEAARQDAGPPDEARIRAMLAAYLPAANGALGRMATCFYSRTADEDFLLCPDPGERRIILASACSGHGFKFAPVIGEILADLAMHGTTRHDIARFGLERPPAAPDHFGQPPD